MLKKALVFNAIFSFTCAMVILSASEWLNKFIPLPGWLWSFISFGLLGFVGLLILMLKNYRMLEKNIFIVVISDIAWIAITTVALSLYASSVSTTGILLVMLVNVVVATLAYFQYTGYKLITSTGS